MRPHPLLRPCARHAAPRPDRTAAAIDGRPTGTPMTLRARGVPRRALAAAARGICSGRVEIDARPTLDFVVAPARLPARGSARRARRSAAQRGRASRSSATPTAIWSCTPRAPPARPRPVGLTKQDIETQARGTAVALGLTDDERWLCPLPLSHVGGLMVLLRSAVYGTTAVLGPADTPNVTLASLVPTQLARLLDAHAQPPTERGPARRRPRRPDAAAPREGAGLARRPQLRPHPDVLGGDDRRDRRHRDVRPPDPRRDRDHRGRRGDRRRHRPHRRPRHARRAAGA